MVSLFFWRKKRNKQPDPKPAAAPVAASKPPDEPTESALLPVQRLVYALALDSQRAADPEITPDATQTQLVMSASQTAATIGSEPRYTPQRPSLLPQLVEAVEDEEASLRALSRVVMQDPRLTGELVRTANSPMYRVSATPVESIERAAALLGTRGIRMLISRVLMKPLAQPQDRPNKFGEIIWEQATYSSAAADAWAARSQEADPFAAQMLALLYGLGEVTVYRVLMDIYTSHPSVRRDAAAVVVALDGSASVAAARIAKAWGLSDRTQQALEAQAEPAAESASLVRALRFGMLAGGLTLLCRHGRVKEAEARQQLIAAGFEGPVAERVWERLFRAYVQP